MTRKGRTFCAVAVTGVLLSGLLLWRVPAQGGSDGPAGLRKGAPKRALATSADHSGEAALAAGKTGENQPATADAGDLVAADHGGKKKKSSSANRCKPRKGGGVAHVPGPDESEKWRPKPIDPSEVKFSKEEAMMIAYRLLVGRPDTGIPLMQWAEFYALVEPRMVLERDWVAFFPYVVWRAIVGDQFTFEIDAQTGLLMTSSINYRSMKLENVEWFDEEYKRLTGEEIYSSDLPYELYKKLRAIAVQQAKIPLDEALERAWQFSAHAYPDFLERNFRVTQKEISLITTNVFYWFRFEEQSRDGEQLMFPNEILVSVHPNTGIVAYYTASNEQYVLPDQTKISKEEAERIAYEQVRGFLEGNPAVKVVETPQACLTLMPGETERVRPWWAVEYHLEGKLSMVWLVWVDAETGDSFIEE